jgi:NAD(P)-dependent dehydrogenase (short-subunit alcohol dehydrogenase family)
MAANKKVAIVTGAGSGIGKATALALLEEGYRVALAGRRPKPLQQTIAEAGESGSQAIAIPTDVSNPQSVRALFAKAKKEFGRIDVLSNDAGINAVT